MTLRPTPYRAETGLSGSAPLHLLIALVSLALALGFAAPDAGAATAEVHGQTSHEAGSETPLAVAAVPSHLDVRGGVGFVIDDTASMGDEVAGIQAVVATLAKTIHAAPTTRPGRLGPWVLSRFNDPGVGPAFATEDIGLLQLAIGQISVADGQDCPELSQQGLLAAIDQSSYGSWLFLFTDAKAKDAGLAGLAIRRAQERGIRLFYIVTGRCSDTDPGCVEIDPGCADVDPVYRRGAFETGGQLFLLKPEEIPHLVDLLAPHLSGDLVTLLSVHGRLSGTSRSFSVPADGSLARLVISVSVERKNAVRLFRPSGERVRPSDRGVHVSELSTGALLTIDAPAAGRWRIEVEGDGEFSLLVHGNSPIDFHRFAFSTPKGDPHGGSLPLESQPVVGRPGLGEAVLRGPFHGAGFEWVDEGGIALEKVPLRRGAKGADPEHFLGRVALPAVPFRVVAIGIDASGHRFRREHATLFRAQPVEVEVDPTTFGSRFVAPGTTAAIRFVVTNHGEPASFDLHAVDGLGHLETPTPSALALDAGESHEVETQVHVPAVAPDGTPIDITLVAVRADRPDAGNGAALHLAVRREVGEGRLAASPAAVPSGAAGPSVAGGTAAPIPTLSEWGLLAFVAVLAAAAMHRLRRG